MTIKTIYCVQFLENKSKHNYSVSKVLIQSARCLSAEFKREWRNNENSCLQLNGYEIKIR